MILGNLYREKGQVGRAINIHQGLLQRPRLTPLEHAHVLLCLGLDFRRGGFVDRALRGVQGSAAPRPEEPSRAGASSRSCTGSSISGARPTSCGSSSPRSTARWRPSATRRSWRFSRTSSASRPCAAGIASEAARAVPARPSSATRRRRRPTCNLGDLRAQEGNSAWPWRRGKRWWTVAPDRAYLAFDRLQDADAEARHAERFADAVPPDRSPPTRRTGARGSRWRGTLSRPATPPARSNCCFEALSHNPHALVIHQAIWNAVSALGSAAATGRSLSRPHARRRLLPRSAHLHALPLPQHRAALAVPAVPRVEHVRRGTHRAGARTTSEAQRLTAALRRRAFRPAR